MRMPGALCLTLLLAQSLPVPSEAGDAAQLERIRRQLADPPAIVVTSPPGRDGPVFRVTVHGRRSDKPVWADLSGVPAYVRPMAPTYHYEFLLKVTPEEFRAGTLYPVGVPIVPLVTFLGRQITTAQRKAAEKRAREEVRQALEELLACRTNPDRPGC
jgi:hypothetical protein